VVLISQRSILRDISHDLHEQAGRFNFLHPLPGLESATRYTLTVDFISIIAAYLHHAGHDPVWIVGGKNGTGIQQEDAEALVKYAWSPQQTLYVSPTGPGGFNYAGTPHSEYFNRQYFAKSLYPDGTPAEQQQNAWYGSSIRAETDASIDGKTILLSWTSQLQGGQNTGIYQICLATVEFDTIVEGPLASPTASSALAGSPTSTGGRSSSTGTPGGTVLGDGERTKSILGHSQTKSYGFWSLVWELGLIGGMVQGVGLLF
jgi:hypothetical protein